jgi:signal transduction histidine kinase
MLTLARAEHLTTTEHGDATADLAVAAASTAQQFQPMAEVRGVSLTLAADEPAFVSLSSDECTLLCSNLLLNALQHSSPRTDVKMSLRREEDWMELRVEDQGDGIDPALLPHVFERFSRGDPSRSRNTGGTGLGLAICKAIVDKAGGAIALESNPGHGTTAVVRLPRAATPAANAALEPSLQATPSA